MKGTVAMDTSEILLNSGINWEEARGQVFLMLINYEANKELCQKTPNIPFLDLVYMVYLRNGAEPGSDCIVQHRDCEAWGISEQELFYAAAENTMKKGCVQHIEEVLRALLGGNGQEEADEDEDMCREVPMFVVSNEEDHYGAAMLGNKGLILAIAQYLCADLFILPSSVHELIVLPGFLEKDLGVLRSIVQEVNRESVLPEEFLSDEVYYFNRDTQNISLIKILTAEMLEDREVAV